MSILLLAEAKELIANSQTGTIRYADADIQADIDTAEGQIAKVVGPLAPTVVTVTVRSYGRGSGLPKGPYIGPVTALTVDGEAQTTWDDPLVDANGFAHRLPWGACTLTYTAGWAAGTIPKPVLKAIREQFRHVWSFRRGNSQTRDAQPGAAHAMPYRVSELIEDYRWIGPKL